MNVLSRSLARLRTAVQRADKAVCDSNAWPPAKLQAGLAAIESYIQSIIDSASPSDILGTTSHPLDR